MLKKPTASLQAKSGKWYVVINAYACDMQERKMKRRTKWISTDLSSVKSNKTKAKRIMEELIEEYVYDTDFEKQLQNERESQLFVSYLRSWLNERRISLSQVTYENYESMLKGRITQYFEPLHLHLIDVHPEDITKFYSTLADDGLKGSTIIHYHAFFFSAMKQAKRRHMITENPFDSIERPRKEMFVPNYYTADQAKQLLQEAKGSPIYVPIVISTYYGLRRAEVCGLRWQAIDFKNKRIVISHKIFQTKNPQGAIQVSKASYVKGEDTLKTNSSYRTLPLIPAIEDFLIQVKEQQEQYRSLFGNCYDTRFLDYVCVHKDGLILSPNYISAHFNGMLKRLGLPHIRFHDLRHSCASMLMNENAQMKNIQLWLGHSDIATTANIYTHLEYNSKIATADIMNDILGEAPELLPFPV